MTSRITLTAMTIALLAAGLARADLLLEEQFLTSDYTVGNIDTQNPADAEGTTGFDAAAAWTSATSNPFGQFDAVATGLSYSTLGVADGGMDYSRDSTSSTTKQLSRAANAALAADAASVHWISVLMSRSETSSIQLQLVTGFLWDMVLNADGTASVGSLGFETGTTTSTYAADTTHMLLAKLTNSGGADTFELWVDPDLAGGEAGLGSADATATSSFIYNGGGTVSDVRIIVTGGGNTASLDELRIATTYGDAVPSLPVPEPASIVLLSLGTLVAMRRRHA